MAATTARMTLPYPTASDSNNIPQDIQRLAAALDTVATVFVQGTLGARPAAGTAGRFYAATDQTPAAIYYDTGAAWVLTNSSTAALFTAKGDVLAASAPGSPARVGVGVDGTSLTARTAYGPGVGWEPVLGLPLALPGATAATRFVGGTVTGAPVTGAFAVGDVSISQDGSRWVCTAAGTPGTFTQIGGASGLVVQAANNTTVSNAPAVTTSNEYTCVANTSTLTITNPSSTRQMMVRAALQGFFSWATSVPGGVPNSIYQATSITDIKQSGTSVDFWRMMQYLGYGDNEYRRDAHTLNTVIGPSASVNFQGTTTTSFILPGFSGQAITVYMTAKAYLNVIGWTI